MLSDYEYIGNRKINVYMYNNDCIRISTSLLNLESEYKAYGFASPHKSYLVNYRYIKNINAKSLFISDDSEIPISHGKKTEIQEQFMRLLRNEDLT